MPADTEKRTVEEIVEAETGGIESMAFWIHGIQCDVCNFVDQWRNQNFPGSPIDWEVVDYHEIPRDFVELLAKVAEYEVRL